MSEPLFHRRTLGMAEAGSLRLLETLCWPTPLGAGVRFYFRAGTPATAVADSPGPNLRLTQVIAAGGGLIVSGHADSTEDVALIADERPVQLGATAPETGLFDDLDVLLGQRHGETADQIAEWLDFQVTDHGAQAALLVNRAEPGADTDAFAAALADAAGKIGGLVRLVLVDSPYPLGQPGQPALGDRATAPRRKDHAAKADPWRAPLAEPLLYDLLRWRFLARAGAVLALEPFDLLDQPEDGIGVFEACRQSQAGLLVTTGETTFVWRIKKGRAPTFGDHICRSQPPASAPERWCVAPKRIAPECIWLPRQITGLSPVADESASYTRAASLLFPQSAPAELADKALLAEDPALLKRATERFGHDPVRPPRPGLVVHKPAPLPSGRTVVVTCMKNEGPFILEWLAYHRMVGVDDFLVYTNDCDDGTDTMLDLLQARGLVQRRDNPFREVNSKPQSAALEAAAQEQVVRDAGWIISMDVDEFLNIHAGQGRLADLYDAVAGANAIAITWRLFGNSDIDLYQDLPVTQQFTRCAPHLIRRPHQAWGFKTLFRNDGLFETLGIHRPKGFRGAKGLWVNGSGRPMPPSIFRTGWRSGIDTYGYDLVTLNHYSVRSAESFLVKRDRGRVNHVTRDQGPAYWFRMNNNDQEDLSIQRHLPELWRNIDQLMQDRELAEAHAFSVAAHRARIDALLQQPEFQMLYNELTSDKMRRLSRLHRHLGMNVFLHGPSVVPDRVLEKSLPQNFFFNVEPPRGRAED